MQILLIQTGFLGDLVLATALTESLRQEFHDCDIDVVIRKGYESVFEDHPYIKRVLSLDKTKKYRSLRQLRSEIRQKQYDLVVNVNRYFSSGFLALTAKAQSKSGFTQNPFSFCYSHKVKHEMSMTSGLHEIERNHALISHLVNGSPKMPKLYPSATALSAFEITKPYVVMAPGSVWKTKMLPVHKWVELIDTISAETTIYLTGSPKEKELCDKIMVKSGRKNLENIAGTMSILQTAKLMQGAEMSYTNDSGPLHIASAMNAPITAFYLSTAPPFGFTPLSDIQQIKETHLKLDCRPCGLHGHQACPKGHFKCSEIEI